MIRAIRDAMSRLKSMGNGISMTWTGNKGVGVRRRRHSPKWRHIGKRRVRMMKKLDESKVRWIIRESRKGTPTGAIAKNAGISARWVQKLCRRYAGIPIGSISYPGNLGRPRKSLPGRREHSAVLSAVSGECSGAVSLERTIERATGMHIPHNAIHTILRDADIAEEQSKKGRRRKWIRYERTHSNSMWHTDYKQLPDGRWFICYLDDASRFVTAWGAFPEATTENAIAVLEEAIARHGKPASIMTDHGSQFYANETEARKRGESAYEKRLVELGIRHILARVKHPQTNGKLERFHGEIQRKLHRFEASSHAGAVRNAGSSHVGDPFHTEPPKPALERFMEWYNYSRAHMSLDWGNGETPAQAFMRKMAPAGETVVDGQTGEEYRAE